jgi:hypothetical protein
VIDAVLKAPFPYFGGKRRAADLIWPRFGDVRNYVEPFSGSCAVLLARPHAPQIETVNDVDCYLANFWRALAAAPEDVARFADWPVNEADLSARHQWLVNQAEFRERMKVDPDYFDAKIAGWWVWGLCAWIGSGWCDTSKATVGNAGQGVNRQLPHVGDAGQGVNRQLPHVGDAGRGVNRKLPHVGDAMLDYLLALSDRFRRVRVACGDWKRVLGDSVTWRHGTTAILLDPPYADGEDVYQNGDRSTFADVAEWATENGADERLRICLCGYDGTFTVPDGWIEVPWKAAGGFGGQSKAEGGNVNAKRERLWFSPGCLRPEDRKPQGSLFDLFSRGPL